jgi:signal peptidase I
MKQPSRAQIHRFWKEQVRPLLILVLVLCSFRSAIADYNVVPTGSMKPSIIEGDRIFVNKLAYDLKVPLTTRHLATWADPKRGDVIVFNSPKDGRRLVKRVIGVPGDTIQLINNQLFVNGKSAGYGTLDADTIAQVPSKERNAHSYGTESIAGGSKHPVMSTPAIWGVKRTTASLLVPAGQYFVMGDNRDNSEDSRYIGCVPRDSIVGRTSRVFFSLNYDNSYLPRADRFFRALP